MPPVGYLLWFSPDTAEFGESLPTGQVAALDTTTLLLRTVYLSESQIAGGALANVRQWLGQDRAHLLRVVPSTDGPPFRSALVYVHSGGEEVLRVPDWRLPRARWIAPQRTQAVRYQAVRMGSDYAWESDAALGRSGFFVTGTSGASAVWRVSRMEADALGRQMVTLSPARLAYPLATPKFDAVAQRLREFLQQHFDALQKAVAGNLYLDVVDRSNSLAEGIIEHCLVLANRSVPSSLNDRPQEARKVLDDPMKPSGFPLTEYGDHLAHRIRLLHQRTHANRAARGQVVQPEMGMSAALDVSELMVEIGLGSF